jgi:hypothetical protein
LHHDRFEACSVQEADYAIFYTVGKVLLGPNIGVIAVEPPWLVLIGLFVNWECVAEKLL